ncbi:MAG: DUF1684 domain-containing protein [Bacteroidetes bacterium]|nr:DUF1684 domain-containing protein [Bacteroidota bacterium]
MKSFYITLVSLFLGTYCFAQQNSAYSKSILAYQKNYVSNHEVVKGSDRKYFHFFPVSEQFKVTCKFAPSQDTAVVIMKTSGTKIPQKDFIRYGTIYFVIHDTALQLTVYQSLSLRKTVAYKNSLFIPFTDVTTGETSYGSGRYIDIETTDIKNGTVVIDFNKAYNPYCAYTTGYNCPIPPGENYLKVAVAAGEMSFGKTMAH